MQPPPLKPRSPQNGAARWKALDPLLPRSFSHPSFTRPPSPREHFPDRLQRHRPMRNALLLLLSLVLAANCVWAVQGLAAWRRRGGSVAAPLAEALGFGGGPNGLGGRGRGRVGAEQDLFLQRFNATTLSVEVSRVGPKGSSQERSTYLLNAQLLDSGPSEQLESNGPSDQLADSGSSQPAGRSSEAPSSGDGYGAGSPQTNAGNTAGSSGTGTDDQEGGSSRSSSRSRSSGSDGGSSGSTALAAVSAQGARQGGSLREREAAAAAAAVGQTIEAVQRLPADLEAVQRRPADLVAQLREMSTVLGDALVAATDSVVSGITGEGVGRSSTRSVGMRDRSGQSAPVRGKSDSRAGRGAGGAGGGGEVGGGGAQKQEGAEAAGASSQKQEAAKEEAKTTEKPPPPPPHRAVLRMPEVNEGSRDECAQALRLPKVALLFLTRGDLFHHAAWSRWFEAARDQLPREQLRSAVCSDGAPPAAAADSLRKRSGASTGGRRLLGEQPGEQPGEDGQAAGLQGQQQSQRQGPASLAAACGWNTSTGQPFAASSSSSSGGGSSSDSSSGGSGDSRGSSGGSGAWDPISQQHLFSVYIHAPPETKESDLPDLFRGRLIADRLLPQWGTHELVEATRNLLWEAFKDPLNKRFVLLSESDIPLYDPLTLHQQLMSEGKSRVSACRHAGPTDTRRWSWRMSSQGLKAWHWRKSSQWFGLMRRHVEVVLQDVDVFRRFEEHCWNGWDPDYKRWRDCFSDEHYIPTLLASQGRDGETSCDIDGIVAVDWSGGGAHPRSYKSWEARPRLIRRARGEDSGCNATQAIADAQHMFISKQQAFGAAADGNEGAADAAARAVRGGDVAPAWQRQLCGATLAHPLPSFDRPLAQNCSLTMRKFPKQTVRSVQRLFTDCRTGLLLLGPAACQPQ